MSKSYEGFGGKFFPWAVLAGCFALISAPYSVSAQDSLPQGAGTGRDPAAIYIQAGADKDEIAKIRAVAADFETKARVTAGSLMTAYKTMQTLSYEPDLNDEKVLATQDQINKLQSELATDHIQLLIAARKILTPEHRAKLVELLKQRRAAAGQAAPQ